MVPFSVRRNGGLVTVISLLVGLAILAWAVFVFNRLVRLRNQVRSAWADIDVQLKRRHDLVPDLVATVTGYAAHERGALERVTELRTQAVALRSPSPSRLGEVESALQQALARVMILQEAYPNLRANETFLQLQRDLVEIEDHLQYARRFYNGSVRDYHNGIQRIPDLAVARVFGFGPAELFQVSDEERQVVPVVLSR
jgi:LemA protein